MSEKQAHQASNPLPKRSRTRAPKTIPEAIKAIGKPVHEILAEQIVAGVTSALCPVINRLIEYFPLAAPIPQPSILDVGKATWTTIVDFMSTSTDSHLRYLARHARIGAVHAYNGTKLVVAIPDNANKSMEVVAHPENAEQIYDCAKQVFGRHIGIAFVHELDEASGPIKPPPGSLETLYAKPFVQWTDGRTIKEQPRTATEVSNTTATGLAGDNSAAETLRRADAVPTDTITRAGNLMESHACDKQPMRSVGASTGSGGVGHAVPHGAPPADGLSEVARAIINLSSNLRALNESHDSLTNELALALDPGLIYHTGDIQEQICSSPEAPSVGPVSPIARELNRLALLVSMLIARNEDIRKGVRV